MPIDVNGYEIDLVSARQHSYDGIVRNGLVLHLDAATFNTVTGTTWYDLSGNSNHGTLTNGPTYNSGNGGSIVFDGTNDYITLPQNSINTNSNFTLSFWAKRTNSSTGTLISGLTQTGHFQLRYDSTSNIQILKAYITGLGSATFSSSTTINSIENIVMVRSTNTYTLYVNANSVGSTTSTETFTTQNPVLGVNYTVSERLAGNIYTFTYHNRALTATEIAINYNALKGRYGL